MSIIRNRMSLAVLLAASVGMAMPGIANAQAGQPDKPQQATPQRAGEGAEVELRALPTEKKIANLEDLVGQTAYDFTLTDAEGAEHTISDYLNDGKIVVLEWFSSNCPIVVRHYTSGTTMNDTVARYEGKDVVWLAVATGSSADAGSCQKAAEKWGMQHPVLLDESGAVGRAYGSKNTPTMYVIGTDGVLAYAGAIDDDTSGRKESPTNYVVQAVDALLAGSNIETAYTKAYGCGVKYKR